MRLNVAGTLLVLALTTGCSIKRVAVDKLGDAIADGTGAYAADDDPDLVRDATPFALKTVEVLLAQSPEHKGLLLAACSGFTQYAHAFLQDEADFAEARDLARATELRARAKKLYLRARNYGLRGLEAELPGFQAQFAAEPDAALARTRPAQVPLLYYTAAAWAAAFALDVTDSTLSVDQTRIEKLARRALALDGAWEGGTLHEFLGAWEAGHAGAGGTVERARFHFQEALRLSSGLHASAYVGRAEALALPAQDRPAFEADLKAALAVDPDKDPTRRTAILVAQKRARWLLSRGGELFNDPEPAKETTP